jgi:tRNA A-37 threonylcarbamoyl transferase component Bud32
MRPDTSIKHSLDRYRRDPRYRHTRLDEVNRSGRIRTGVRPLYSFEIVLSTVPTLIERDMEQIYRMAD